MGGVAYGIIASATWARDTIREQDRQQASASVVTVYPDPVACTTDQLEIAMSAPSSVAVGAGLSIGVTLTNTGSQACLLDVGSASLGAVITSGGVGQWSSLTCPAEPAERMLLVDAGQSTTTTLYWDGHVSTGECAPPAPTPTATEGTTPVAEQSPTPEPTAQGSPSAEASATATAEDPTVARAGTYVLRLEMGGTTVTEAHVFTIG